MSLFASIKSFLAGFFQPPLVEPEILFVKHPNPKVSIVLPVYNQVDYIDQSINSVLNQTYKNIELIVVNDGSTDGTELKLAKYSDLGNVILHSQENRKLPAALNKGFEFATGDYYTWTSADNIMMPNQVELLLNYLETNLAKAFVYSNYQLIDENGEPFRERVRGYQSDHDLSYVILPNTVTEENFHDSENNFIGASFLYRREAAAIVGDYAEDLYAGEDYDYFLRLHNLFRFGHITDCLYKYRVHRNTITAKYRDCMHGKSNDPLGLKLINNIKNVSKRDKIRREYIKRDINIVDQRCCKNLEIFDDTMTVILNSSNSLKNNHVNISKIPHVLNVLILDDTVDFTDTVSFEDIDIVLANNTLASPFNKIRTISGIVNFGCQINMA